MKRILMPTDGSTCSERAIVEGLELAKALGAEVTFLYIVEDPFAMVSAMPGAFTYRAESWNDLMKASQHALRHAQILATKAGVKSTTRLVERQAPVAAIREAEKDDDLVIMGTHGRRGFNRFAFGSVAEGVLRIATKPCLLICHPDDGG
jgi:nucleotide-binding universal stress UspA family protein